MRLRPRQKTFVERSVAALASRGNTLGVAPTGAGKTIMLSAVTGEMIGGGAKACVLAHRDELTAQNRAKFQRVVPGVAQYGESPNVMRGEETQIAGFLSLNPGFDGVICLPGTHTKWAQVSAGEVVSLRSFMTGELFALLSGAGLEPVDRKGFVFNPLAWGFSISDRDLSVNYAAAARRPG